MFRKLLQTGQIEADGRAFVVHYFELRTARGAHRVSCEVVIEAGDRIILDDDSLVSLQARQARFVPATLDSRALATRSPSVAA